MQRDLGPDGPTRLPPKEQLAADVDEACEILQEVATAPGKRARRYLEPGGRTLDVYPLLFGRARLCVSRDPVTSYIDDVFEYPSLDSALTAMYEWDGTGDAPYGWDRHPRTSRRRPEGDATREHVHD